MENVTVYLKKFQIALLIVFISFAAVVILVKQTIPTVQKVLEIDDNYKTKLSDLEDAERQLSSLNEVVKKEREEDEQIIKAFFKPINVDADAEAAISEEFDEVLQLLRENKIRTRSLSFDPDPKDDNFVKHVGNKYFVSRINAEMIASYSDFENFLRDLYKHEHFIDISRIKVVPYSKNKRILLIDLQIKLYAQKDPNSVYSAPMNMPSDNSTGDQVQPAETKNEVDRSNQTNNQDFSDLSIDN